MIRQHRIFTLGPKGTDSERAAKTLSYKTVELVSSFTEAFQFGLAASSDVLCPAGYRKFENGAISETWVDLHFEYSSSFKSVTTFVAELMPLGLYENPTAYNDTLCAHPTTTKIAELTLRTSFCLLAVDSKPLIPRAFLKSNARYALHPHMPVYTDAYQTKGIRTLKVFSGVNMIWVRYQN